MPYKFGEYVSTYVDPQSVAISETLRNRFMENFKANDQLTMAVEQMKAALPFENDMAKKKELETQINQKLETLSSRGDYENLGFAVHKAAKEFSTSYAPIKENYDRYQSALKELDEQYKKGDINAEDYNMATSYIVKGYKGFEVDPTTGRVKEGTMYSAPTIYKDPKLMDKIKERLEILYEKKTGQKSSNAGLDANGVWKVTSGSTLVEIPEEDVMDVYNSVIQEPDVRMYLDQRADMKLYMADRSGNTGAYLEAKLKSNQSAIDQINQAIASGKYSGSDKKILGNQITALNEENKQIQAAKADPNLASNYLRSQFRDEILDPIKQYALKKAGVRERTSEYSYENNFAIQLENYKAEKAAGAAMYHTSQIRSDMDASGGSIDSKTEYLKTMTSQIESLKQQIADAETNGSSKSIIAGKRAQLNAAINAKARVESQIEEATNKSISFADLEKQDPTLVSAIKKSYPNATAGDIFKMIMTNSDALKTSYENVYGINTYSQHLQKYYSQEVKTGTFSTDRITTPPSAVFKKFNEKVEAKFPEVKDSRLFNDGKIETGNSALNTELTKAADDFFLNRPLKDYETVTIINADGKPETVTGNSPNMRSGEYKIKKRAWNAESNTWELSFEGKDGTPLTGIYDGRQITHAGIENALSNPELQFGAMVMQMKSPTPGSIRQIKTVAAAGVPIVVNIESNGDSEAPYVFFTREDGTPYEKGKQMPTKFELNDPHVKEFVASGILTF